MKRIRLAMLILGVMVLLVGMVPLACKAPEAAAPAPAPAEKTKVLWLFSNPALFTPRSRSRKYFLIKKSPAE